MGFAGTGDRRSAFTKRWRSPRARAPRRRVKRRRISGCSVSFGTERRERRPVPVGRQRVAANHSHLPIANDIRRVGFAFPAFLLGRARKLSASSAPYVVHSLDTLVAPAHPLPLVRFHRRVAGVVVRLSGPATFHRRPQLRDPEPHAARHRRDGAWDVRHLRHGGLRRGLGDGWAHFWGRR